MCPWTSTQSYWEKKIQQLGVMATWKSWQNAHSVLLGFLPASQCPSYLTGSPLCWETLHSPGQGTVHQGLQLPSLNVLLLPPAPKAKWPALTQHSVGCGVSWGHSRAGGSQNGSTRVGSLASRLWANTLCLVHIPPGLGVYFNLLNSVSGSWHPRGDNWEQSLPLQNMPLWG